MGQGAVRLTPPLCGNISTQPNEGTKAEREPRRPSIGRRRRAGRERRRAIPRLLESRTVHRETERAPRRLSIRASRLPDVFRIFSWCQKIRLPYLFMVPSISPLRLDESALRLDEPSGFFSVPRDSSILFGPSRVDSPISLFFNFSFFQFFFFQFFFFQFSSFQSRTGRFADFPFLIFSPSSAGRPAARRPSEAGRAVPDKRAGAPPPPPSISRADARAGRRRGGNRRRRVCVCVRARARVRPIDRTGD